MRLALIVLGWVVVFCALCRAGHLGLRGKLVRMSMVISWAILAFGATLLQMEGGGSRLTQVIFATGIVLGAASFAIARLTHGKGD